MSAEGKKKRGESGQSNTRNIPFRYHGFPRGYTLSTAHGNSQLFAGSRFLNAMRIGTMLPGFAPSQRALNAADDAMEHCPTIANL